MIEEDKLKEAINKINYENLLHTLFYKYFATDEEIKEMDDFIKEILEEDETNEN